MRSHRRRTRYRRTTRATCAAGALALAATVLAATVLAVPAGAAGDAVDAPAPGTAAATTFALLSYSRELCDGIAGRLIAHWRGLGSAPEAQLATMRRRIVDRELAALASARAVADLVTSLLPRAREESGGESGAALKRLQALGVELCDAVAYPSGTRQAFEAGLADVLDRIEREETQLGRKLVVTAETLRSALSPYLGQVQIAGVEAEGEYLDYLDSLKPPPKQPTLGELMAAWHRGYSRAVLPTKQALGRYLRGRRDSDLPLIRSACREILAAVIPLLHDGRAFRAPLPAVTGPLEHAFTELRMMALECTAGRSREVEDHYLEMQSQLATVAGLLAQFELKP